MLRAELFQIQKDGDVLACEYDQLPIYFDKGYALVPVVAVKEIVQKDIRDVNAMVLVPMVRKGVEIAVEPNQVKQFQEQGYKVTKGVSNGQVDPDEGKPVEGLADQPDEQERGIDGVALEAGSGSQAEHDNEPSKAVNQDLTSLAIADALGKLDHKDDAVWTVHGNPRVAAVEKILGYAVTMEQVRDAIPGFKRDE